MRKTIPFSPWMGCKHRALSFQQLIRAISMWWDILGWALEEDDTEKEICRQVVYWESSIKTMPIRERGSLIARLGIGKNLNCSILITKIWVTGSSLYGGSSEVTGINAMDVPLFIHSPSVSHWMQAIPGRGPVLGQSSFLQSKAAVSKVWPMGHIPSTASFL
jgi:hypothetical protein